MGWEARDVGFTVALRLDSHGGDREREHEKLADELDARLRAAVLAVIREPRYAPILAFTAEHYESWWSDS